jgi:nucleoside-diphosphate-sugar epimerase
MRILVIGGTTFMGPHVVRGLAAAGHQVTVFHRGEHEPDLPSSVRHIHSPAAAYPVVAYPQEVKELRPEIVLHMNCYGEADAQALVEAFGGQARRLVIPSSCDVYRAYGIVRGMEAPPLEPQPLIEESPLRTALYPYRQQAPNQQHFMYHYDKTVVERVVSSCADLPATILRYPAVYGPGDPYHRFFVWLKRMQDGRPAILLPDKQAAWRWSHGYSEDVAAATVAAVLDDRAAGRIYNIGEDEPPSVAERVRHLGDVIGWKGEVVSLPDEKLPAHLRDPLHYEQHLVTASGRIHRELGDRPRVSYEEGLRRTVEWQLAHAPGGGPLGYPAKFDYGAEDAALAAIRRG